MNWLWFSGASTDPLAHKHLPPNYQAWVHESPMVWHSHVGGNKVHVHENPYQVIIVDGKVM